ncbi:DUF4034 domain-containing protein [Roseobacter ponti]|uniref:DUF4034 domain-containing protein n=1 Tax=Roseobacter ponti TaxID=1891787 RepID=A0A858STF7_9RHOB|nr:DUF4034 domain-containing protein [Roseobacter ponti]QJF51287.1 DUF4034 domain-containing protein [Roseobacter ponti]
MAHDGDISGVSEALGQAQQDYLDGYLDADDIRALFAVFKTTDRQVIAFISDWLAAEPDAPMPNVARADSLEHSAWLVRGISASRELHEDALRDFAIMVRESGARARAAWEADPDLIPASDAVINQANLTGKTGDPRAVIDHVLGTRPNWGTLRRSLYLTHPGYNGSARMLDDLCEHYAPMLPQDRYDLEFRCKFWGAMSYHAEERSDWLDANVDTSRDPYLDLQRVYVIVYLASRGQATREQIAFARRIMEASGQTDVLKATDYDRFIARSNGFASVKGKVERARARQARELLENDPYHHELLDAASITMVAGPFQADGTQQYVALPEAPDNALLLEYVRRRLLSRPYDPALWSNYADGIRQRGRPEDFLAGDIHYENAAYYSYHDPAVLTQIVNWRIMQWEMVEMDATGQLPPEWSRVIRDTDTDYHVLCPFLRAHRLLRARCETEEHTSSPACNPEDHVVAG